MRKIFAIIILGVGIASLEAQQVRKVAIDEHTGTGITYSLPKNEIVVTVEAICTKVKAGIYAPFAEKYLGMTDVPLDDLTMWEIKGIGIKSVARPDTSRTFHIEITDRGAVPTFYLTEDGRLWGINEEPRPVATDASEPVAEEAPKKTLTPVQVMNEELLKAGSRTKQAEIAARQIFRIRESRLNLLTGEVDNLPADGASFQLVLDNLGAQEKAYLALFNGEKESKTVSREFRITPSDPIEKEILFRFSSHYGFADVDDLGGEPFFVSLSILEDNRIEPVPVDPKAKKKTVERQGIAYLLPGKAKLSLQFRGKNMASEDLQLGQFGRVEQLPATRFSDKKNPVKAIFNPNTGAISVYEQ